jgi:hypothetical protein
MTLGLTVLASAFSYLGRFSGRRTLCLAAERRWCYSTPWEASLASPTGRLTQR